MKALLAVTTLFVLSVYLFSQTPTATLSGTVRDSTGAVVPNAKLALVNSSTGLSRTVTADDRGRYVFAETEPGAYEVRPEAASFKVAIQKSVVLTVGGTTTLDITLQVGSVSEVLAVSTAPSLIETPPAQTLAVR